MRDKYYIVAMPDDSEWAIPVSIIALNHAQHHANKFDSNTARSLEEGTWPLFEKHPNRCIAWASNHMSWSQVEDHAVQVRQGKAVNYTAGWRTGMARFG